MNRGRLCTLAAALLHDVGQAVAVEGLDKLVHPQALVTARVEARLGLKLAAAALLCIELRARLGEQLLPLRREIKREMTGRSREIISAAREKTREIARGGCGGAGPHVAVAQLWACLVGLDGDGRTVDVRGAKLPRPRERSVLDHHELGNSVGDEHRLRWGARASALLRPSLWQQVAPPGWASTSRRAPKSKRALSPWSQCTGAPPSQCHRCPRSARDSRSPPRHPRGHEGRVTQRMAGCAGARCMTPRYTAPRAIGLCAARGCVRASTSAMAKGSPARQRPRR